jgi:Leucine-rich repeat (LRR) protein
MPSLRTLELSYDPFSGSLATELGLMTGLYTLGMSAGGFTRSIPTHAGAMVGLSSLALSSNSLSGSLPFEMSNMISLLSLSLDNNEIGGTLPADLAPAARVSEVRLQTNALWVRFQALGANGAICASSSSMPLEVCSLRQRPSFENGGLENIYYVVNVLTADCSTGNKVSCSLPDCCTACFSSPTLK